MKNTGASTPDAYSFTFANILTNILIGAQNARNRYFYDAAGNLTRSERLGVTNVYFYNAQNKLVRVEELRPPPGPNDPLAPEWITYECAYDSQNRRVGITRTVTYDPRFTVMPNVMHRVILHDGTVPVGEAEHNADEWSTELTRFFVRGAGIAEGTGDVIAEIIGTDGGSAKAVFYLSNHRGDTLAAYRRDSTLVAKYRYDAFGNQRTAYCVVNEPENAPRYTFSTKEYLPAAGLYLYQYRAYDPIAGRWTQRDPIDYQDSINLYQFCGNNPVNKVDPFGLKDKPPDENTPKPFVVEKGADAASANPKTEMANAYNCYSHALFDSKGDGTVPRCPRAASHESAKRKLKNDYTQLKSDEPNQPGDRVAYVDKNGNIVHIGIVTEVDKDGNTTRVESKFGAGPLVSHHPQQTIDPETNEQHYHDTARVYYRAIPAR